MADLHKGVIGLQDAKLKGRPYKRNTIHDKIKFLLQFNTWLAENQITSWDEVLAMIAACQSSRDRAMVSILYEAGLRISEIGKLCWGNITLDEYGARVQVWEKPKTRILRTVRLTASKPFIAAWKNDYP